MATADRDEGGRVHDRAGRVHPGLARLLAAVVDEHRQRAVRLLHLGEPLLPALPHRVQRVEPVETVHPRDHHDRRRRCVRADLEHAHEQLAARERAVDGGQVRDQEGHQREAHRRLDERDEVPERDGRPEEAQREQRRAGDLEGVGDRQAQRPVDRPEADQQQHQPPGGEEHQGDRAVVGHDPVAGRVRPRRRRREVEALADDDRNARRVSRSLTPRGTTKVRMALSTVRAMRTMPASATRTWMITAGA